MVGVEWAVSLYYGGGPVASGITPVHMVNVSSLDVSGNINQKMKFHLFKGFLDWVVGLVQGADVEVSRYQSGLVVINQVLENINEPFFVPSC